MMSAEDKRGEIRTKLQRIYGEQIGEQTYRKLLPLLKESAQGELAPLTVTQQDVMLICYGDQLQNEEDPPLAVLHQFLKRHIHPHINAVHILPFYPWSSDDGFSVIDYEDVDPALGDWTHIQALQRDFRLMFDAVFNHISVESEWFAAYRRGEAPYDTFFIDVPPGIDLSLVVRPRALPLLTPVETANGVKQVWTTFSADQADLNYGNPRVLLEMIRILLLYVERGADFIRLDAIGFLWKEVGTTSLHLEQTHLIIQIMRAVLDVVASHVVLITETNVPHEENISYFGDGENEAQLVYQFPLPPLILHTLTAGDATHLTAWAQSLEDVSQRTTFFNFTASHDGIGLRPATGLLSEAEIEALVELTTAHGGAVSYRTDTEVGQSPYELNITYFDAITDPAVTAIDPQTAIDRFIVSQAMMLALAGLPGVYFHSLFGSRNWQAGVRRTGRNRSINREKLDVQDLEHRLADPDGLTRKVFDRYLQLINLRAERPAMHPLAPQQILSLDSRVFAVQRSTSDGKETLLLLHNVTGEAVTVSLPGGSWRHLLFGTDLQGEVELKPYEVAWLMKVLS